MEIKFKNVAFHGACVALFASAIIVFFSAIVVIDSIIRNYYKVSTVVMISTFVLIGVWALYFLCFIFFKTVTITDKEITVKRWNKVLWIIFKEDIIECVYQKMTAGDFILPNPNAGAMFVIQKGKKLQNARTLSMSFKKAQLMLKLDYNIRFVDDVNNQK